MAKITNTRVYGIDESIFRSGYPMMSIAPSEEEFFHEVEMIEIYRCAEKYENPHIKRAIKLAQAKGGGHDQYLTGVTVTFDLTLSNKAWLQAERYKFLNFISSTSVMHRIQNMNISESCNSYVRADTITYLENLQKRYNNENDKKIKDELFLELVYNLPSGFEMTAGMITNYRCLKNIWGQRCKHKLSDWDMFCTWIQTLPMAKELICGGV